MIRKIMRNLLLGVVLFAQCSSLLGALTILSPALAAVNLSSSGVMGLEQSGSMSLENEFESIVQHYCFIAHNLIARATKNKVENAVLSAKKTAVVSRVERDFQSTINTVRQEFFSAKREVKEQAINRFANYVFGLCREFGVRKFYVLPFPAQIDSDMPLGQRVMFAKQAVAFLEITYDGIRPLPSLATRVKNKLFYNFFSTKVLPKFIMGGGIVATVVWGIRNGKGYAADIKQHPHHNSLFWKYRKIEHNARVPKPKKGWLARTLGGALGDVLGRDGGAERSDDEEQGGLEEGVANVTGAFGVDGEQAEGVARIAAGIATGFGLNGGRQHGPARRTPVRIHPCGIVDDHHICNKWKNELCPGHIRYFLRPSERLKGDCDYCGGLKSCRVDCDHCYAFEGFNSPHVVLTKGAWALRPLILLPIAKFLSGYVYDAQIDEYNHRLRQRHKLLEEQKIHAEMRLMKVNYEDSVGFEQIKGLRNLIDREMRMIVDYLKHPFRYKNSASGTRSILLYGPPGTGKTLLARAIAKESGTPFLEITADDILGENSKEKVLATMRLAEEVASKRAEKSAIIYIDEIDCVTGDREKGNLDPQRAKALSNMLAIFDGIEKRNPYVHVVIVITTNHYKTLDAALLRPGRIDRKILIAQPDAEGRKEFFEELLPEERKHLMDWLTEISNGYSGAQIVNIMDTAQMIASYNGRPIPDDADYRAAVANCQAEFDAVPDVVKMH